jgi:hypothetical protein
LSAFESLDSFAEDVVPDSDPALAEVRPQPQRARTTAIDRTSVHVLMRLIVKSLRSGAPVPAG